MKSFPESIHFKYPWRNYQQKVLEELEEHMKDRHLHVVAPPGSGKTVLGLEVAIRINKPTLILAPTLTIRNQWIERLCELFLDTSYVPDWISTDIRKPSFLTVCTYQGLHAACLKTKLKEENQDLENEEANEEDEPSFEEEIEVIEKKSVRRISTASLEAIIKGLKEQNVGTIVVDEAHHLKSEWWSTLIKVKNALNPFIVGLTATPPYDVSYAEWKKYIELNGPIDSEISIPQLIQEGDLCPHQDHIYFSLPTESEKEYLKKFRKNARKEFREVLNTFSLIKAIMELDIWTDPESNLEWIYENLPIYTSMILFIHEVRIEIQPIHFNVLGVHPNTPIPALEFPHLEILLNFFLFQDKNFFNELEETKELMVNRLKRKGLIEKNKVNFCSNSYIDKFITNSKGKLKSIKEIVEIEYNQLKSDLRMVILSDYIRSEYLNVSDEEHKEISQIGVIPIFEYLRIHNNDHKKIAVLTGSISLIPKSCFDRFEELCTNAGLTNPNEFIKLYQEDYLLINSTSKIRAHIVQIITRLFQEGEIEILTGTKSLLGEGWDAPAINSLVLASFVGSFVLSNQMRGRAIRTQKDNPQKTSNIWHLVCIDPTISEGGNDLQLMSRRFKSFIGLSNDPEPVIGNRVERLNITIDSYDKENVEQLNLNTISHAVNRISLRERWNQGIGNGTKIVEEIRLPYPQTEDEKGYEEKKRLYWHRTIAYLIADLGLTFLGFCYMFMENLFSDVRNIKNFSFYLTVWLILLLIFMGRKTYKTAKLYIKYRDISKDIQQIGEALLRSLAKQGTIKTNIKDLVVKSYHYDNGTVHCYLKGGTTFEQTAFIDNLQEIVDKIENPRYIIIRKSNFIGAYQKKDYHSVPEVLGRNKKMAEHFSKEWKGFVGPCELIYTRTMEGRKILLNARIKSLSNKLAEKPHSEQVSRWR